MAIKNASWMPGTEPMTMTQLCVLHQKLKESLEKHRCAHRTSLFMLPVGLSLTECKYLLRLVEAVQADAEEARMTNGERELRALRAERDAKR